MRRLLCLGILALAATTGGCADNGDLFTLNGGGGTAPASGSGQGGVESTTHGAGGSGQGGNVSTATSGGNTGSAGGSTGQGGNASSGNGGNASTGGNTSTGNGGNVSSGQGGGSTGMGGSASTATNSTASATGSGGTMSSGQGGSMSSGGGGGGPDCDALLAQVNQTLAKAQQCKVITINDPPCKDNEPGLCCEVVVAYDNASETTDYLDALMAFFQAGCVPMCPDPSCNQNPTGHCQASGTVSNMGVCVAN